jgi:hypothetical protein
MNGILSIDFDELDQAGDEFNTYPAMQSQQV